MFLIDNKSEKLAKEFILHLAYQAKDRHTDMLVCFADLEAVYKDAWWQCFFPFFFTFIRKKIFKRLVHARRLNVDSKKNETYKFAIMDNLDLLKQVRNEK